MPARKLLLESCNLHTVLECPGRKFQGAGAKTVVRFFEKGAATRKVWFYQLNPARNLGKTNPLNDHDLAEFVKLYSKMAARVRSESNFRCLTRRFISLLTGLPRTAPYGFLLKPSVAWYHALKGSIPERFV